MSFNFTNPKVSADEISGLATPGRYLMEVRGIRARAMGQTGKVKAEIFLTHADPQNFGTKGVSLDLFRSKEDQSVNSEVSQKFLTVLGKSLGLDNNALTSITWAVDNDAPAGQYGELPAALGYENGEGYVAITTEDLKAAAAKVEAVIDIEEYQKRDGTTARKNIVKAISLPR